MTLDDAKKLGFKMIFHRNGGWGGLYVGNYEQKETGIQMEVQTKCSKTGRFGKARRYFIAPNGDKWRDTYEEAFADWIHDSGERKE